MICQQILLLLLSSKDSIGIELSQLIESTYSIDFVLFLAFLFLNNRILPSKIPGVDLTTDFHERNNIMFAIHGSNNFLGIPMKIKLKILVEWAHWQNNIKKEPNQKKKGVSKVQRRNERRKNNNNTKIVLCDISHNNQRPDQSVRKLFHL